LGRKANGKLDSTKDDIDYMMDNFVNSDEISFISLSDVSGKEFFDTNDQVKSHTATDDTVTISTYKVSPGDVRYTEIKTALDGPATTGLCLGTGQWMVVYLTKDCFICRHIIFPTTTL
jgi:hypothetical protein